MQTDPNLLVLLFDPDFTTLEIATYTDIPLGTVKRMISAALIPFGASTRAGATVRAIILGVITSDQITWKNGNNKLQLITLALGIKIICHLIIFVALNSDFVDFL